ncbi:MAG: hypothetical protein PHW56_00790 [Methanosarcinaceae archaeon]|nr:hypothetical protein [Methanosarcinaceae archaeon]
MNPRTSSYATLSEYDKYAVKATMKAYNKRHPRTPFFEVDEFFEKIYSCGGLFL